MALAPNRTSQDMPWNRIRELVGAEFGEMTIVEVLLREDHRAKKENAEELEFLKGLTAIQGSLSPQPRREAAEIPTLRISTLHEDNSASHRLDPVRLPSTRSTAGGGSLDLFDEIDTNADGVITREEWNRAHDNNNLQVSPSPNQVENRPLETSLAQGTLPIDVWGEALPDVDRIFWLIVQCGNDTDTFRREDIIRGQALSGFSPGEGERWLFDGTLFDGLDKDENYQVDLEEWQTYMKALFEAKQETAPLGETWLWQTLAALGHCFESPPSPSISSNSNASVDEEQGNEKEEEEMILMGPTMAQEASQSETPLSPLAASILHNSKYACEKLELSGLSKKILGAHSNVTPGSVGLVSPLKEVAATGNLWGETRTMLDDMIQEVEYLNSSSQHRTIKDLRVVGTDNCFICAEPFGTMRWRRQCKRCRRDVCSTCSPYKGDLKEMEQGVDVVSEEGQPTESGPSKRLCKPCFAILQPERDAAESCLTSPLKGGEE